MTDLHVQDSIELEVKNFGPINEAKIDLRPLTVFVGPSNTGKSYLAILIYALHQYFSDEMRFGYRNSLIGGYGRGGRDKEPSKKALDTLAKWVVHTFADRSKLPNEGSLLLSEPVVDLIRPFFTESSARGDALVNTIFRCFGADEAKALIRKRSRGGAQVVLRRSVSENTEPFAHKLKIGVQPPPALTTTIPERTPIRIDVLNADSEFRDIVHRAMDLSSEGGRTDEMSKFAANRLIGGLAANILPCLTAPLHLPAFYLPADRTGIMHAHRVVVSALIERATMAGLRQAAHTPMLSGVLADFLEQLIRLGNRSYPQNWPPRYPRSRRLQRSDLGMQIEKTILGGSVRIDKAETTNYPSFTYRPEGWKDDLPLMNASSMVLELAPVVLYLRHIVEPGNVLIIEEPESHLHPAMQVEFTRQIAALVRAGVRVIITTHSEWVLEELANIVRLSGLPKADWKEIEGGDFALRPDEVGAWLFQPKNHFRGSVVKEIPLDDSGLFPSGFDEVAVALHNNWAEISSRGGASG